MSHDQPYLLAEKKIKQTLKSGVQNSPSDIRFSVPYPLKTKVVNMARDEAYLEAEKKIEQAQCSIAI
jgi:hypothetical protein